MAGPTAANPVRPARNRPRSTALARTDPLPLSCALFFASGFAALVYENLWLRHLGLIFGNTVHAAATVLTAYMIGLSAGAHFGGRWVEPRRRPIRLFGFLELSVGAYAAFVPTLFGFLRIAYRFAFQHVSQSMSILTLLRFSLSLMILIVPTFLMGATLPVLAAGLARRREAFATRLGMLYACNTLGAVAGVALCGFVLIPTIGLWLTNLVSICINLLVATAAVFLSYRFERDAEGAPSRDASVVTERGIHKAMAPRASAALPLAATAICGAISLGFEIAWFRTLILVFGSTTYSFAAMLSVFLTGLAFGSLLLSWLSDRVRQQWALFGFILLGVGIYSLLSLYWFSAMPGFLLAYLRDHGMNWGSLMQAKILITIFFLLMPTIGFGGAFTCLARILRQIWDSSARSTGEAVTCNALGAAAGSCIVGFILLPRLGVEHSVALLSWTAVALGIGPLWINGGKVVRALAGVVVILSLCFFAIQPPTWNRALLAAGPYFLPWGYIQDDKIVLNARLQMERLEYFKEGNSSLVAVVRSADERLRFTSNGKVEADTTPRSMMLQRMVAHLPMLFHPHPRRVVNIGLGAGVTFGSLGVYHPDTLEVIEIEPAVIGVAKLWGTRNHHCLEAPHARVIINDGRNQLFATGEQYDVITADPFEPLVAGAGNLYTVEHFAQARSRLAPGGMMAQFLPLYEMSQRDFFIIMRSFAHVFPHSYVFFTGIDSILLGCTDDAELDMKNVREKFHIDDVKRSLAELGLGTPESILAMLVVDIRHQPGLIGSGPLNTDAWPIIEFSAPKHAISAHRTNENQKVLLDYFTPLSDTFVNALTDAQIRKVKDSREALRLTMTANLMSETADPADVVRVLRQAHQLAPDQTVVNATLSYRLSTIQPQLSPTEALAAYGEMVELDPGNLLGYAGAASLLAQMGQLPEAERWMARALERLPDAPVLLSVRAQLKKSRGDSAGAIADVKLALSKLPDDHNLWNQLADLLKATSDDRSAAQASLQAERLRLEAEND